MKTFGDRRRSFVFSALILLCAAEVFAHVHLESQNPRAGSTLSEPPQIVRLQFSGSLKAEGSRLWFENAAGHRIAEAEALPMDGALEMVCPLPKEMRTGRFHVYWFAATSDGHQTQGDYWFSVYSVDQISP